MADKIWRAAVLVIGDEILSGRTRDTNTNWIARWLTGKGVRLAEVRVVPDVEADIVAAVNALRSKYDYVFTTGGIGPTHDDITSDSIAKAFGVELPLHPEACRMLDDHYKAADLDFTEERQRMARIPLGGNLIENPVSTAPGYQIENVFVMAGVPQIMQAMLDGLDERVEGGAQMLSESVTVNIPESELAGIVGKIQDDFPDSQVGSYPWYRKGVAGVEIVVRTTDPTILAAAIAAIKQALED